MTDIDCSALPEAIAEVLGGEASPARTAALTRHVAACAACARSFEGLDRAIERARAVTVPDLPDSYWTSFLPELRRRIDRAESRSWLAFPGRPLIAWLRPLVASGALAAVVVAVLRGGLPGPLPAAPEPDLAALHALAVSIDRVEASGPLASLAADGDVPAGSGDDAPTASGDVFAFLDLAADLEDEEREAVLAALVEEFHG